MPKPSLPVLLFAAAAVAGLGGLFLWPAAGLRHGNTAAPAAGPAKTAGRNDQAENPTAPVVAAAANPTPPAKKTTPDKLTPDPSPRGGWAATLRELAATAAGDPHAALVRVAEFNEAEERQAALKEVCTVIARRDPALAFAAAWRFELGKLGGLAETQALESLAKTWAAHDLDEALAWLAREPQDKAGLRDHAVKGIAASISHDAPAGAALLIEAMPDNRPRFEAAVALGGERVDPAAPPVPAELQPRVETTPGQLPSRRDS